MSGNFRPKSASTTAPTEKDRWGTQWGCFADACALYGKRFNADVCAEPETSKCGSEYFGPKSDFALDGLGVPWVPHWWCNPPFSKKQEFIRHARAQQKEGRGGMMLLPYEPCTGWWQALLAEDIIIYEPMGRYNFFEVDGVTKKDNVNFPSALVCFPIHVIGAAIRVPFPKGIGKHLLIDGVVP